MGIILDGFGNAEIVVSALLASLRLKHSYKPVKDASHDAGKRTGEYVTIKTVALSHGRQKARICQ